MDNFQAGVRVKFIGPEYRHASGPFVGQVGTLNERVGHTARPVNGPAEELVTVYFDGDKRNTVLALSKLETV